MLKLGTCLHICSMAHPFNILKILGNWSSSTLPLHPRFCLLGNKTMIPNITNNKFNILKVGFITAARLILQNWKNLRCPTAKEWINEMIQISSYELMLGRINLFPPKSWGETTATWVQFWLHIKLN